MPEYGNKCTKLYKAYCFSKIWNKLTAHLKLSVKILEPSLIRQPLPLPSHCIFPKTAVAALFLLQDLIFCHKDIIFLPQRLIFCHCRSHPWFFLSAALKVNFYQSGKVEPFSSCLADSCSLLAPFSLQMASPSARLLFTRRTKQSLNRCNFFSSSHARAQGATGPPPTFPPIVQLQKSFSMRSFCMNWKRSCWKHWNVFLWTSASLSPHIIQPDIVKTESGYRPSHILREKGFLGSRSVL